MSKADVVRRAAPLLLALVEEFEQSERDEDDQTKSEAKAS